MGLLEYFIVNNHMVLSLLIQHINLTIISVCFAILIGVPLGVLVSFTPILKRPVLGFINTFQAVPSIAFLGFAIPVLGIGSLPAIVAVTLYSLLPIVKNTVAGIDGINPETLEAAEGIGMSKFQILRIIEIPLAFPYIMAGVRISAVTAVGLMTIASFIGAGGLGYLVFAGIRTVNNVQILAGAVPACLLALFVDYVAASIEKTVTPGLKKRSSYYKTAFAVSSFLIILIVGNYITSVPKTSNTISIGGKDFTEHEIIVNMFSDYIEYKTDLKVDRKVNLGGTQVSFNAVNSGKIDISFEYTGTAYGSILKGELKPGITQQEVYEASKKGYKDKYNLIILKQMAFNNTYALAVKKETAQNLNLYSLDDLINISSKLKFASTLEFLNREDGFPGLESTYSLKFNDIMGIDGANRYIALNRDEVDIIDVFTTEGLVKKYELVVLKDPKGYFLPYYSVPVIRAEVLSRYPYLENLLNELGQYLDEQTMVDLNYRVDELKIHPSQVAKDFLLEKGLIK